MPVLANFGCSRRSPATLLWCTASAVAGFISLYSIPGKALSVDINTKYLHLKINVIILKSLDLYILLGPIYSDARLLLPVECIKDLSELIRRLSCR
jgi:hypothetical protein